VRDEPEIGAEIGGYRLESVIARGGMGVVYLAEDVRMGRTVALKILPGELAENERFRARFLHESRVAGAVNHPNVIPVYDAGESEGLLYISMRYVEGTDLRGLLRTEGPLDVQRAVSIISQTASALGATHQRGLIHRDVKPANMLLVPRASEDGTDHVYLSDFGLAKNLGSLSGLTKSGQFMGTVGYVAPEQIRGKGVDKRTDVYALGCVLFECLTGWPPFRRKDDFATIMAHVNDAPQTVSDLRPGIPAAIDDVVARALAKDPADRFDSCEEMGSALRRAAGAQTGMTPTPESVPEAPAPPSSPGSVWFDAEVDKVPGSRADAPDEDVDATEAVWLDDDLDAAAATTAGRVEEGGETVWEEAIAPRSDEPDLPPPPPPPPPGPDAPAPASPPRRFPGGARGLLGLLAVGCLVVLAVVLLGGGDDDQQAASTPAPAVAPPPDAGPARADSAWRVEASSPSARQQVATAVLNGRISLIGGLAGKDTATATAEVESYDPAINTWNTQTSLPHPLHHATAVGYRGELVVIGGWEPQGSNLTATTSRDVLALRDGRWVRLPSLRHARAAAAAAVVDDRIVVVGGQANDALVPQTEVFDGTKWRDAAPLPTPREHLAAASDGQYVYVAGGRNRSSDRNTAALERYDPRADRWTRLRSMPVATGSMGAAIVNGRLVVVGGEGPSQVIKNVQSYDPATDRWSQLAAMRTPRHGLGVAAFGTTLYALDGARATGHSQSTNVAEALNLG
jgi:serine/threonine protein kinase/N-acetylneuraminic acid mutarotase